MVFLHPLLGAGRIMNTSRCMCCGNCHEAHENHSPCYTPPNMCTCSSMCFPECPPSCQSPKCLHRGALWTAFPQKALWNTSSCSFLGDMVRVGNFVNKCKCAIRVETKSKTTTLWTHEKWRPKCDVMWNIAKMTCFVYFAQGGMKNRLTVVLLLILP